MIKIVKEDITKIKTFATVNAANESLLGGGGVDGAIHKAAGPLLLEECKKLKGCKTGDAKITNAYDLPARFIIHTPGPVYRGGNFNEAELLDGCYEKSLSLFKEKGGKKIAFPLISAGVYGYPKKEAIEIAVRRFEKFVKDYDCEIILALTDEEAFSIAKKEYPEYV